MAAKDPDDPEDDYLDLLTEALDESNTRTVFNALIEAGVALPAPAALDDSQLHAKLWEVINGLAELGVFLHSTDHLSDRELYTELWNDHLREPGAIFMPGRKDCAWHIDLLGSGSEEDMYLIHKYYASEEERRAWLEEWPKDVLPEHEDPPYDRDRLLPRAEDRNEPVM